MQKTIFSLIFVFTLILNNATLLRAQLVEVPLSCNKTLYGIAAESPSLQARPTVLTLPFFDDFSYKSSYPNPFLWQNSRTVWVNEGMGKKPPTIGVATFDGLNSTGTPYDWAAGAAGTGCDTLLSQPIDLSSVSFGDSVYLSFFYQPGGFGDMPEFADKLFVDFKNSAGVWATQKTINGQSGIAPDFKQISIKLSAAYLTNPNFQFRLRNVGSRLGTYDAWQVDYVKLAKNRRFSEPNFNDVAFYETAASPFKDYTALPYEQFKAATLTDIMATNVNFKVVNQFNIDKSPILSVEVFDSYSGAQIVPSVNPSYPVIPPSTYVSIFPTTQVGLSSYTFSNLPPTDSANLVVRYSLVTSGEDVLTNQPNYQNLNNTVQRQVPLRNYYAYDDGSAESNVIAQNSGTQAAVKFHTYNTAAADTLQGIQMHVPAFNISVAQQLFNFSVYLGSLNSTPVYEAFNLRPSYGDSLQYWATYPFISAVNNRPAAIPANTDFYIVWQQVSAGQAIPIGLDKNSTQGTQFIFQNTGGGWNQIGGGVSGALMIRPFMGNKRLVANENIARNSSKITAYPNPTTERLYIKNDLAENEKSLLSYSLFDVLGSTVQTGVLGTEIDLSTLQTGFYILKVVDSSQNTVYSTKIIKQ